MKDDDERLEEYFKDVYEPYSREELEFHSKDRWFKITLEDINSHNYRLSFLLDDWEAYLAGKGEKPETNFSSAFTPARSGINNAKNYADVLCDQIALFEHGSVKRIPILAFAMRSSLTIIERLKNIRSTQYIKEADITFREFMDLVLYRGKPQYPRDGFKHLLRSTLKKFLDLCAKNAQELDEYVRTLQIPEKPLKVAITTPIETKLNEADKKELVKPVKNVERQVKELQKDSDHIYAAAVEGKPVDDGKVAGRIRRKMVLEGAGYRGRNNVSYLKAARAMIEKYQGRKGAYTDSEVIALEKAIGREFRGRK